VEEAKPKVPHDDGLTCINCGANAAHDAASQWRGPHKRYCSKAQCKKAATVARKSAGPRARGRRSSRRWRTT
jgi:hypothetical protein